MTRQARTRGAALTAARGKGRTYLETDAMFDGAASEYRYSLLRRWVGGAEYVAFIGLNPSTADAQQDDPTIRRCIRFATDAGYGALVMLNLFGLRSTDPLRLHQVDDPVGPGNDAAIVDGCRYAALVVAAWGHLGSLAWRGAEVRRLLDGVPLHVLRVTQQGFPAHPLYLPAALRPRPWTEAA